PREAREQSSAPNSTLPVTVSQGNSAYSWNTTPRSGAGPLTGRPSTRTVPVVGARNPATMFSKVDLPQPDGPRRHTNSRSATSRSISPSAGVAGPGAPNDLPT